ncbi:MAG TPA: hypothetical protein VK633_11165 [Verrucomicrobiae bacterium]|nr:hypothetical protein [Verrucomicrobiae bacterium]
MQGDWSQVQRRIHQLFLTWLLVAAIGGHWPLLQSVAWLKMMVRFSQTETFSSAVTKTFSGKHPCDLCLFVAQGKKSEGKQSAQPTSARVDFFLIEPEHFHLAETPAVLTAFSCPPCNSLSFSPPVPPPKSV